MITVKPQQLMQVIVRSFPWAAHRTPQTLSTEHAPAVGAITKLAHALPPELLPDDPEDRITFAAALGALEAALNQWAVGGPPGYALRVGALSSLDNRSPLRALYEVLSRAPNQAPTLDTSEMAFVADENLRRSLRQDLSDARADMKRGSWKSATVLAGSVLEALLLDAVEGLTPQERDASLKAWRTRNRRQSEPGAPKALPTEPEEWHLYQLLWVAHCAGIISEEAVTIGDAARGFRNLIHPGKLRTSAPADEASAMAAIAAALRVISERNVP